ncbi:hypothetical protein B0H17DRAFT_1211807 [Mycena rosella]|uniref:Uncharacterized protein n=1 Tax=Mycena rosella TaxID=1033263 RepID=A0AAD7G6Z0_MYCRO|nr:hypothetical protein B0H17DRAFT_1211807 [Mycena rosella]
MADEDAFLIREEGVARLRMERGHFNALHMLRLVKLSKEPGFTATIVSGRSVCRERHTLVQRDRDEEMRAPSPPPMPPPTEEDVAPPHSDDNKGDAESDDDDGEASEAFLNIVRIVGDNAGDFGGN